MRILVLSFALVLGPAACSSSDSDSQGQTSAGSAGAGGTGAGGSSALVSICTISNLCEEVPAADAATKSKNDDICTGAGGVLSASCPAAGRLGVCVLSTKKQSYYAPTFSADLAMKLCAMSNGAFTPG